MSRTNPQKLKPQRPKTTILAYGEGLTEESFLKYLKDIYCDRYSGLSVKINNGEGGDPKSILDKAIKNQSSGDYQNTFILLDTDKKWPDEFKKKAKKSEIKIIGSVPCIEGLFLLILTNKSSSQCKKEFEKKYLDKKKKLIPENYKKIFPKKLLEKRRKKIPILDEIISIMTSVKNEKN